MARIVAALVDSVDRQSHQQPRRGGTDSLSAYGLFLQGRELRRTATPANFAQAQLLLDSAAALDPNFAPAHGELAYVQHFSIGLHIGAGSRADQDSPGPAIKTRSRSQICTLAHHRQQVLVVALAHLGRIAEAAAALADWRAQCGHEAPQNYLDRGDTLPGPEYDRMRDGLRLAGLADG